MSKNHQVFPSLVKHDSLKQINPEYAHPNKNVPYLIDHLTYSESRGFWDTHHMEQCSFYMPNWSKAENYVRERIYCETEAPRKADAFGDHADIFSDEFRSCFFDNRPFLGPIEWLRASRFLWRYGITLGVMWLAGGSDKKGEASSEWEENNKGWLNVMIAWAEKGQ